MGLGQHHQAIGIRAADIVALIDLTKTGAAIARRPDTTVVQLQLGAIHVGPIADQAGLRLGDQRSLGIQLLTRDQIIFGEALVAHQIASGVVQQRRIARQRSLGLLQLDLERAWVDFSQQIAGLHLLPLREVQLHQLAIDPAAHGHGIGGGDGAQPAEVAVLRGAVHDRRLHGNRLRHAASRPSVALARRASAGVGGRRRGDVMPGERAQQEQQN